MKKFTSILIVLIALLAFGNIIYGQAKNNTTSAGYYLKAKINGKPWQSTSMAPADASGRIVGYYNGQYIGLPYSKENLVVGKKIVLNQDEAADVFLKDGCSYPLTNGQMEITKVTAKSAEGTFYFTTVCSSTKKSVKISEGFFRIQVSIK